jgi:hypothetical protein
MQRNCKGCEDRHEGCHTTCEIHKEYRKDMDEQKKNKRLKREIEVYLIQQSLKNKRRKRRNKDDL